MFEHDDYGDEYGVEEVDPKTNFKFVGGIGYQFLDPKHTNDLEEALKDFKKSGRDREVYIQEGEDVYQIVFNRKTLNNWTIKNIGNEAERVLRREKRVNGPFITQKTYKWEVVEGGNLLDREQDLMSATYSKSKRQAETKAKAMRFAGKECLFVVENRNLNTYIMALDNGRKWKCASKVTTKRWDAVSAFKPPPELSIEKGRIVKVETLDPGSAEFKLLSE